MFTKYHFTLTVIMLINLCGCYTVTPSGKTAAIGSKDCNVSLNFSRFPTNTENYCKFIEAIEVLGDRQAAVVRRHLIHIFSFGFNFTFTCNERFFLRRVPSHLSFVDFATLSRVFRIPRASLACNNPPVVSLRVSRRATSVESCAKIFSCDETSTNENCI